MSTTNLLIEHLITGVQTLVWLILGYLLIVGWNPTFMELLTNHELLLSIIAVSLTYPLGIFIDNLSDLILDGKNETIKTAAYGDTPKSEVNVSKVLMNAEDETLSDYFGYIRMRIRVSRSSFFNFLFITIFGSLFLWIRTPQLIVDTKGTTTLTFLIISLTLTFLAFFSWHNITENYHQRTIRIYKELKAKGKV